MGMVVTVVLLLLTLTLGLCVASFTAACLLWAPRQRVLSQMLFVLSAPLAPITAFVLLYFFGLDFRWPINAAVAALLLAIYAVAYAATKRNVLILLCAVFASWWYFAVVLHGIAGSPMAGGLLASATILLGALLLAVAHEYRRIALEEGASDIGGRRFVADVLSVSGAFVILGEGIVIGGIFDFLYLALVFAAFFAGTRLKYRGMVVVGSLFLCLYMCKVGAALYVGSIDWIVALGIFAVAALGCHRMFFYAPKQL